MHEDMIRGFATSLARLSRDLNLGGPAAVVAAWPQLFAHAHAWGCGRPAPHGGTAGPLPPGIRRLAREVFDGVQEWLVMQRQSRAQYVMLVVAGAVGYAGYDGWWKWWLGLLTVVTLVVCFPPVLNRLLVPTCRREASRVLMLSLQRLAADAGLPLPPPPLTPFSLPHPPLLPSRP